MKIKKELPMTNLIGTDIGILNAILQESFNKPGENCSFGIYLIDEEMGTGTDF